MLKLHTVCWETCLRPCLSQLSNGYLSELPCGSPSGHIFCSDPVLGWLTFSGENDVSLRVLSSQHLDKSLKASQ